MKAEKHLALCESISLATGRMRAAAERADWDALVEVEQECSLLIERLRAEGAADLDTEGRRRKVILMRSMLDDDRAIRERTQPELARLHALLSGARRAATYNAIGTP
jgi:flagellar protein FliT